MAADGIDTTTVASEEHREKSAGPTEDMLIPTTVLGKRAPLGAPVGTVTAQCRHAPPDPSFTFHIVDNAENRFYFTGMVHIYLHQFNRTLASVTGQTMDAELKAMVSGVSTDSARPFSGFYTLEGKTVCIEDQHKQGIIRWSFKSKEDFDFLVRRIQVCVYLCMYLCVRMFVC